MSFMRPLLRSLQKYAISSVLFVIQTSKGSNQIMRLNDNRKYEYVLPFFTQGLFQFMSFFHIKMIQNYCFFALNFMNAFFLPCFVIQCVDALH